MITSEDKTEGSFHLNRRRNLDDEFTPGIFDVHDIISPRSNNDSRGGFFQYRPIVYISRSRSVSSSSEMTQGAISDRISTDADIQSYFSTLPYSYFGHHLSSLVVQGTNLTFGSKGDGFFGRTNYTSFSMLMGIGAPPKESLSSFVVTFAAIGLGVPLLVLLFGGAYVCVKRYRS